MKPYFNLPPGTIEAIWCEAKSPRTGGYKEWVGCRTPDGLVTLWGAKGRINQKSEPMRHKALWEVLKEKLCKGYRIVGSFENNAWSISGVTQPPPPESPPHKSPEPPKPPRPQRASILDEWVASSRMDWF